jgi:hypothetical protein
MSIPHISSRKETRLRGGRAAVLWGLGLFLVLQLGFHFPLSWWLPQLSDVEYGKKVLHLRTNVRVKPNEQPLVLALGSSLTAMAVRPDVMTGCQPNDPRGPLVYNFAINGGSIRVQHLCVRRLLAEGLRPNWVLVETYPPFFLDSPQTNPMRVETFPGARAQWQDFAVLAHSVPDPRQFKNDWRDAQCWPWFFRRNMLQNWLLPTWLPEGKRLDHNWAHTDRWGWEMYPAFLEKVKPTYDTPAFKSKTHDVMQDWNQRQISMDLDRDLRALIDLCQRETIGVVLIWVPESSHFRQDYSNDLLQRIEQWQARLGLETGVPIVHARDWLADDDFIDGLHMTPEGATHYSQRLESEVMQRILKGQLRYFPRKPATAQGGQGGFDCARERVLQ